LFELQMLLLPLERIPVRGRNSFHVALHPTADAFSTTLQGRALGNDTGSIVLLTIRARKHFSTVFIDSITKARALEVGGHDRRKEEIAFHYDSSFIIVKRSGQSILFGG